MTLGSLPTSWTSVPISEVLAPQSDGRLLHHGWSPQCESEPAGPDEWGALKTTAIQDMSFQPVHNKRLPKSLSPRPHLAITLGDLLITCAGPRARCGVAWLVRSDSPKRFISGKMYRFRTKDEVVDPRYLEAYLSSPIAQQHIDGMKTGISDSGLNLTHERFLDLPVPVPPLSEQRRIVEAIEANFARLDEATSRLASAKERLQRFRAAILKSQTGAVSFCSIEEVVSIITDGEHQVPPRSPSGVPFLSARNVRNARVVLGEMDYISPELHEKFKKRLRPSSGDVLISCSGSVGRSAMVPNGMECSLNRSVALIRPRPELIYPQFLMYSILSPELQRQISQLKRQTAQANIFQHSIRKLRVPAVPIAEQVGRVEEIERALSVADLLDRELVRAAGRLLSLRQTILSHAFAGRLVPQDPKDEPASVLLERIKRERSSSASYSRGRVRRIPAAA